MSKISSLNKSRNKEKGERYQMWERDIKDRKEDVERREHDVLVKATEIELQKILVNTRLLSDISFDLSPEELFAEISLAKSGATTVYVERDGLPPLTIVLPQAKPTVVNLKRAIEKTSRVQIKRELRERDGEHLGQRHTTTSVPFWEKSTESNTERNSSKKQPSPKQVDHMPSEPLYRSTGELVYAATRNGHQHRSNVSWRFLWRVFALYNIETNSVLNDENGRKLLSEYEVKNFSTLRFCKRKAYFGRKR